MRKFCIAKIAYALLSTCFLTCAPASAQQWPSKPVRMIVPAPPGQTADVLVRVVTERLPQALGQVVLVDNRQGASGLIGSELAAKSRPDGYTFLVGGSGTLAILPNLHKKLGYDPLKDFAPVTNLFVVAQVFCVNPALPVHSIPDLIALAKRRPGDINYGSSGNANINHILQAMFAATAGVKLTHVAYSGSIPSITALISGEIALLSETAATVRPFLVSGKMRAIGVFSAERIPLLPAVPTLQEQGIRNFEVLMGWNGIVAPTGTPEPILERLNTELVKVLSTPEVKKRFYELGVIPVGDSPEHFAAFIKAELAKWADAVRISGARME